jgi:hypothetical protein
VTLLTTPWRGFRPSDAFRLLVLRWSLDEIADRNGWRFHTDGIHLNSRGGKLVADLVQTFVRA